MVYVRLYHSRYEKAKIAILIYILCFGILCEEVDTQMIEKKEDRIIVCGRFRPSDVVVKLQKKMKRRVEILEVEDLTGGHGRDEGFHDHEPPYEQGHEYSEQQPDHMTTPLLSWFP